MRKRAGWCVLCEARIATPNGSPFPSSRRWQLLLCSGRQSYVTTCGACAIEVQHLPELWDACVRATAEEDNGFSTEAQEKALWCMVRDLPLAVLGYENWGEVMQDG